MEPPTLFQLQNTLEEIYNSNLFETAAASRGASSRRQNKRGNVISRRAETAGTGGAYSLKEWHALLERHGIGELIAGRGVAV